MKFRKMKYMALACALIFSLISFVCPVAAEEYPQLVYDDAYYLDDQQYAELNERAVEISRKYECAVHFVITENPDLNEDNIQQYAEDLYLSSDVFGYGPDKDGFMLVLGTVDRCYWLLAYGDYGNYALTDYGKEVMVEEFLDDFGYDLWYEGFSDYLDQCELVLSMAAKGQPLDIYDQEESSLVESYGIAALVALFVSFILCEHYKSQMKTAVSATTAGHYVQPSNVQVHFRKDRFAFRTTTRTKIESSSSKSSGKGTTTNSRGFSGKGGKF